MGDDLRYFLDFLKVLHFSFPVPVVGPRTKPAFSLAFAVENIKFLPLALRARRKIWARLVGKSRYFLAPTDVENFEMIGA